MHISNCNTVFHYWHFRPIKFISLGVLTWLSANKALRTETAGMSLKNIDSLSSFLSVSLLWNFSAFKNASCVLKHESKRGKIYVYMFLHVYGKWYKLVRKIKPWNRFGEGYKCAQICPDGYIRDFVRAFCAFKTGCVGRSWLLII